MAGMFMAREKWQIKTLHVLDVVFQHRIQQVARWGLQRASADPEQRIGPAPLDGTGPDIEWLENSKPARHIEEDLRRAYDKQRARGIPPTWMELLREEVSEAFCEDDPVRLREELVQVAAVAVSWVEDIDTREPQ